MNKDERDEKAPLPAQQSGGESDPLSAEQSGADGAPAGGAKARKTTRRKVFLAVCAVLAAAVIFLAGFFTYYATLPSGARALLWMWGEVDANYYYDVQEDDFWNAAIDGAEGVLDQYSEYYSPDEYAAVENSYAGQMEGTGLSFFTGTNRVSRVAIGSPVFFANGSAGTVQEGMFLTGAGTDAGALTVVSDSASATAAFAPFEDGDTVYLRFSAENDPAAADSFTLTVTFSAYTESYVLYACGGRAYAYTYDENRSAHWTDVSAYVTQDEAVNGDTAYIRIVRFAGDAATAFARAAMQYQADGATSLLLDLRNNGGGRMDILQRIASYLLRDATSSSEVVQTARFKDGSEERYVAEGNYFAEFFGDSAVYVAANVNSASASEALIGAMYSYGTVSYADIYLTKLGENTARTYGKGIMQTTFTNIGGGAVKLTTAQIYWPNGTCIHGVGITENDSDASGSPQTVAAESNADYNNAALTAMLASIAAR